jgi:hypothetical protein
MTPCSRVVGYQLFRVTFHLSWSWMLYFPRNFRSYPPTHVLSQPQHTKILKHSSYVYLILLYIYICYIFESPRPVLLPQNVRTNFQSHIKQQPRLWFFWSFPLRVFLQPIISYYSSGMSNTYISHHLPPTCFGVCYTIFRETIALLTLKTIFFFHRCYCRLCYKM